ncbi:AAA family ATPase [Comamonas sp. Z1]|uniref:TniB family NTP-binding protein n=1 Tax=Comamonas sp. Z1 TaxID=2601246 RepID=UPI000EC3AB01|nr:TniB family NTP-binding protein [Comamonas sp. Z1]RIK94017.1 MAG: AAA family ATPase [Pseudomonadota bacterium]TYK74110.1 AAA family ATPase [Comamonas sp. Z1]
MTDPYPDRALSERAKQLLEASAEERIDHIRRPVFIPYARATEVLDEMAGLLDHPQTNRMPNLLLVGRSNNGKTEILKEFRRRYPAEERAHEDSIYVPVLYVQCPPGPNDAMFLDKALRTLGVDPKSFSGTSDKIQALAMQLVKVKTKVLLLDELNSVLAGSVTKQLLLLTIIKYLSNETKISIVAAGTVDALQAVATDAQLQSRFPVRPLKRWRNADRDFRKLLLSFEYILPLRKSSNLSDLQMARLIYGLSEGVIGSVATLIRDSAVMAIQTDEEAITEDIVQRCAALGKPSQDDLNDL